MPLITAIGETRMHSVFQSITSEISSSESTPPVKMEISQQQFVRFVRRSNLGLSDSQTLEFLHHLWMIKSVEIENIALHQQMSIRRTRLTCIRMLSQITASSVIASFEQPRTGWSIRWDQRRSYNSSLPLINALFWIKDCDRCAVGSRRLATSQQWDDTYVHQA